MPFPVRESLFHYHFHGLRLSAGLYFHHIDAAAEVLPMERDGHCAAPVGLCLPEDGQTALQGIDAARHFHAFGHAIHAEHRRCFHRIGGQLHGEARGGGGGDARTAACGELHRLAKCGP